MRQYVQRKVNRYADPRKLIKYSKSYRSQAADKAIDDILKELTEKIELLEEENGELRKRVEDLERSLKRQHRHVRLANLAKMREVG